MIISSQCLGHGFFLNLVLKKFINHFPVNYDQNGESQDPPHLSILKENLKSNLINLIPKKLVRQLSHKIQPELRMSEWKYYFNMKATETIPPGANPTITSYNASVVNLYNAMGSLARFENNNILLYFEKRCSLL
jgi:hypothetical protein